MLYADLAARAGEIDREIGERLRQLREVAGMTPDQCVIAFTANATDSSHALTVARLRAIEEGSMRISAADLFVFCKILDARPADLYTTLF